MFICYLATMGVYRGETERGPASDLEEVKAVAAILQCAHCSLLAKQNPSAMIWHCYDTPAVREKHKKKTTKQDTKSAHQVMVEGSQLNYEVAGTGTKVALCLPGALGSATSDFGPQLSSLAGEELTLVGWDPPGYGKSRPPPRTLSNDFLRQDARLAAQMMETLGYEKFALLGWSDGGITALMMAAAFPQQVSELVVWGGNAFINEEDVNILKNIRDVDKWSEKMRAPLEAMYGKEYFRATWEGWVDTYVRIYEEEDGDLCRGDLEKISCPTLIVHGRKDPVVPWQHAEYLCDNIKAAKLVYMEDGKHNIHLRYPEEFNKLVKEFLQRK